MAGVSTKGIVEQFPTRQPISLYGATKLASEIMGSNTAVPSVFPFGLIAAECWRARGSSAPLNRAYSLLAARPCGAAAIALHRVRRFGPSDSRRISS